MKARVAEAVAAPKRLGRSRPLDCLNRSRLVMYRLAAVGWKIGGVRITERIEDTDGKIVLVMEDGDWYEVPEAFPGER